MAAVNQPTGENIRYAEDGADLAPHISAAAEPLGHFGPFTFTNSMLMMFITMALLLIVAWLSSRRIRQDPDGALVPEGLQNAAEAVVEFLDELVQSTVGTKFAQRLLPIGATFFIFILVANWFSLLPGIGTIWMVVPDPLDPTHDIAAPIFRPATADINMTLALAILAFLVIHVSGIRAHNPLGHIKEMSQVALLAPVFILIELFVVISLSFRLFGNLFAGEVVLNGPILAGFALGHIPLIGVVFLVLELLFGLVQAVIFFMLSMVFTGQAVAESGHEAH
ncbi:MAG: F0F1 ATP synthase subunit A [Chloroflexota bacterium]|nr:F0F1 ATP synthase subunit A [Chloroflexota bacterium]